MSAPLEIVTSREGDSVDLLLWRHRGGTAVMTEQVLELNTGLADRGPVLAAGVAIALPPLAAPVTTRETVKLWD